MLMDLVRAEVNQPNQKQRRLSLIHHQLIREVEKNQTKESLADITNQGHMEDTTPVILTDRALENKEIESVILQPARTIHNRTKEAHSNTSQAVLNNK